MIRQVTHTFKLESPAVERLADLYPHKGYQPGADVNCLEFANFLNREMREELKRILTSQGIKDRWTQLTIAEDDAYIAQARLAIWGAIFGHQQVDQKPLYVLMNEILDPVHPTRDISTHTFTYRWLNSA